MKHRRKRKRNYEREHMMREVFDRGVVGHAEIDAWAIDRLQLWGRATDEVVVFVSPHASGGDRFDVMIMTRLFAVELDKRLGGGMPQLTSRLSELSIIAAVGDGSGAYTTRTIRMPREWS